jgi:nucleoside-diphosphate-sugar epimerase
MLRNVLDVCRELDIRLIFPSGWEIYSGYQNAHLLASECTPPLPRGPYGETKFLCEQLIDHHVAMYGLRSAVIRSSPVYGSGGNRPRFIYTFREQAARGLEIITHRYINGPPALDLMHVNDFVELLTRVAESTYVGKLNAGTARLTTTEQVAELLVRLSGSSSVIRSVDINAYTANVAMDSEHAREVFGWRPEVALESGLRTLW